jgi:cytoskeleton protein RodZ
VDGEVIIGFGGSAPKVRWLMALHGQKESIGQRLRRAREDRDIALDQAARETRIDRTDLEALEGDSHLPEPHDGIYARIFLREYARYLGLNPRPLVEAYRATHPEPDRPLLGGPAPVERRPGRWAGLVLAIISAVALIGLVVAGELRRSPEVPVSPATMAPPTPSPTVDTTGQSVTAAPSPNRLVLQVVQDASWIRVSREGDVLVEGTQGAGWSHGFRIGGGLDLVLGNAGAVRLTAGGRSLGDLGNPGEVYAGSVLVEGDEARLVP